MDRYDKTKIRELKRFIRAVQKGWCSTGANDSYFMVESIPGYNNIRIVANTNKDNIITVRPYGKPFYTKFYELTLSKPDGKFTVYSNDPYPATDLCVEVGRLYDRLIISRTQKKEQSRCVSFRNKFANFVYLD